MAEPKEMPGSTGVSSSRTRSELSRRVGSALVLGLAALLAAYQGGVLFASFWLLAALAILLEWTTVTGAAPRLPLAAMGGAGLLALGAATQGWIGPLALALLLVACGAGAAFLARTRGDRVWAVAGFAYAAVIAVVPPLVRDDPGLGLVAFLWMLAVVWSTDIAAYFVGRRFGGPKLWPKVSPKKTWSGFCGGVAAGTAAGTAVAALGARYGWTPPGGLFAVGLLSAAAAALSQLGDLAESAWKRRFGVKDSSHLIPGHGGVMDRLDAFWAVAALMGLFLIAHKTSGAAAGAVP